MNKHVISILVDNQPAVLSRVSGLFSRRGYNIDSLSVGITENLNYARITIVARGDVLIIDQIKKQLEKLVDTVNVTELYPESSVYRELALLKVSVKPEKRSEIMAIVDIFRANIIDVSTKSIIVEMTGETSKIDAFLALAEPYGIEEIARTGLTGLQRGNTENTAENAKIDII